MSRIVTGWISTLKAIALAVTVVAGIRYHKKVKPYLLVGDAMQKTGLIAQLIGGAMLSFGLASPLLLEVQAQEARPVYLFDTQCVSNGPGRAREETLDVAVGRKVYRSYLFLGPGSREASITCRILPEEREDATGAFQSLLLDFGMRDNDRGSPPNVVTVYLDGVRTASETIRPGEKVMLSLNVSEANNVAIETVCSAQNRYCDRLYFFEATLSPDQFPLIVPETDSPDAAPEESEPDSPREI
ncbi:hypothetical protein [Phormidium sp. CCY1219]|uniref:hypothetical protein n=1 Tax=Phormidium sp. CCY1219 TaxID=2886104 RepID=UPI002D1E83DD|nr:hypothetical protein [Phormidium sp. CCY1219]MEB3831698.1 hypothetical protein [Phormidium sp. CCY1219]